MDINHQNVVYVEPKSTSSTPMKRRASDDLQAVMASSSNSLTVPMDARPREEEPVAEALGRFRDATDLTVFTADPLVDTRDSTLGRSVDI